MDISFLLYYFLIFLLYFLSLFISLIPGVIDHISVEDISGLKKLNPRKSGKLLKIKSELGNVILSFHLTELLLFTLSVLFASLLIFNIGLPDFYLVVLIAASFIIYILLRTLIGSMAIRHSLEFAAATAGLTIAICMAFKPFILLAELSKIKFSGISSEDTSLDELNAMVETAREEGSLEPGEYRILKNIMIFSDVLVSDVMTPRTVLFSIEADKKIGEVLNLPEMQMYSRFPVWEGESLDDGVVGYVMSKDVLRLALAGKKESKLRELSREIHFIPENASLDIVLDMFLQKRQQLFLVVDEYGGIEGLLTMEDVIETILGVEIVDEADKVIDLRQLAKQRRDKRISGIIQSSGNEEEII